MKLYTATAMREVDRIAIEEMGVPSLSLMENAAQAVAGALARTVPEKLAGRVVILCGKGNNGGDGMAVARLLAGMGYSPTAWLAVPPEVLSGDARVQFDSLGPAMVSWRSAAESPDELKDALSTADLVVDALLGTGLGGPVRAPYLELVRAVNESPAFVAAVDIPSGMAGDSLQPIGEAVRANLTLTLALPKPCLYIREGAAFAGTAIENTS
jgi:NAD(P)H-hydrate epimerase